MRKRLLAGTVAIVAIAVALIPKPELLPERGAGSKAFLDADGRLLRLTLSRDQKYREHAPLESLSPLLVEATLLQEDRHFRRHAGVNPVSFGRAVWRYVAGGRRVGASTITMQVARMTFELDTRTPRGKLVQVLRALQLERHYTKDEILEAYLDLAPYSANVEGAAAASRVWFHKSPADLTLAEALTLTVIPQNPSKRNPAAEDREPLRTAAGRLFDRWAAEHPEDRDHASALASLALRKPSDLPFRAPHFVDAELRRGAASGEVTTTLDGGLQRLLERHLTGYVERERAVGLRNGAAILLDHRTMQVKALVGSADWFDALIDGQVDGTSALRSPGSALKPFVYALAFEQGLAHPRTLLKDSPVSFGGFSPENSDGAFAGPVLAADALNRSRNVPAVELASRLKEGAGLHELLSAAAVPGLRDADFYGLAVVLGGAEVRMRDLVRLYAMLPNGGRLDPLRTRVSDPPPGAGPRLLTAESSYLTLEVLAANPRPESPLDRALVRARGEVAWKTGTSHGFRDAWAVGVVGPYVLAVWIGNFDGAGDPSLVGIRAAAPLFFRIADSLAPRPEVVALPAPRTAADNLAHVEVCALSGGIPGDACPRRVSGWFIPGVSPIHGCEMHRAVAVDSRTGRRACDASAPGVRTEVHEFWPSDLLALYRLAGIPRRAPPAEDPACPLAEQASRGVAPAIVSPRTGVVYSVRSSDDDADGVELSAVVDADVRRLYWFQDERLLGVAPSGDTLTWKPGPGSYRVRAVDDHGRSAARSVTVERVD